VLAEVAKAAEDFGEDRQTGYVVAGDGDNNSHWFLF
jgi:hypothetical protein